MFLNNFLGMNFRQLHDHEIAFDEKDDDLHAPAQPRTGSNAGSNPNLKTLIILEFSLELLFFKI